MRFITSVLFIPIALVAVTVAFMVRLVFGRPTRTDLYP